MPATQGNSLHLRTLLPNARFIGGEIQFASLTSDHRQVQPGDLYVAVDGIQEDGHLFVTEAVARGATAVVAERHLPVGVPVATVDDSRTALGVLCQALVGNPTQSLRTIGVTGSLGKTVTSMLIASVLEAAGRPCGVLSTLGYSDSLEQQKAPRTTPYAPELAHWLARTRDAGCRDAVIELSSRALAERRTAGVEFDIAVMTNFRREHAQWHGSLVNYRKAKERLFAQLKPGGLAVLNADDIGSQTTLESLHAPVLTFGKHLEANVTAEILERHASEQTIMLHAGDDSAAVCTRMIGEHHVSNCLAAATVGLALGIDLAAIARGLEKVAYVPGRMERIECGQSFRVFVDGGRTPDSLAIALRTARQTATGRVICVFGCQGQKDKELRPLMGRVAERAADLVVITSDNPRHEEPLRIAHDVIDGMERPGKPHVLPDRRAAIEWALSQARAGDAVVIAGKGDREYHWLGSRRQAWSDREIACQWLYHAEEPVILKFHRPHQLPSLS